MRYTPRVILETICLLWTYLYVNYYAIDQLGACSPSADEILALKMTIIIESTWRRTRHDYIHHFNYPRINLVVWVLITYMIPQLFGLVVISLYKVP